MGRKRHKLRGAAEGWSSERVVAGGEKKSAWISGIRSEGRLFGEGLSHGNDRGKESIGKTPFKYMDGIKEILGAGKIE